MATPAAEYLASIWNNERGLVPLLFILAVFLTIFIGLGFCIYHCGICGRTKELDLDLDLGKAIAARETAIQIPQPPTYPYPYSRTRKAGKPPLASSSPRPHPPNYPTCECSLVYGPCHRTPMRDRHMIEIIYTNSARPACPDDPPAYEELMAFGRA